MLTLERGLTVGHTLLAVLTSPHFVSSFLCFYFHEGEGGGISTQDACNLRCFLSGHITEPCSSVVFPFLAMDQMCSASARSLKHDFLIFLFFFLSQYSSLLDHLLISSSLAAWLAPYNAELTGYVYFVCLFFFFSALGLGYITLLEFVAMSQFLEQIAENVLWQSTNLSCQLCYFTITVILSAAFASTQCGNIVISYTMCCVVLLRMIFKCCSSPGATFGSRL